MKPDILKASSKYQIGGLSNHRVEEHLIVVKAIVGRSIKRGAEELNDLTKEISRKVGLEMKLKLIPECDSSNLKSAVSNTLKKHMKAQCEAKTSKT